MQDQHQNSLIDPMGDSTQCVLNLILLGRATPYVHNGELQMEVEESGEVSAIFFSFLFKKSYSRQASSHEFEIENMI